MAQSNNVIKIFPASFEDDAVRLYRKRLEFMRAMMSGRLTDQQVIAMEIELSADWLEVANQYDL
ncbi:MAG: hypothetical protein OIF55_16780 [Amphritea sp.]|nr:hypothetical protein [Amphritea sp.]